MCNPTDTWISARDLRDLVAHRLWLDPAAEDVREVCKRLCILAGTPRGQELSTALPPSWWADVAELQPFLEDFSDVIECIRLFFRLRPHANLYKEFVEGG
jgi:hypothetical protein